MFQSRIWCDDPWSIIECTIHLESLGTANMDRRTGDVSGHLFDLCWLDTTTDE